MIQKQSLNPNWTFHKADEDHPLKAEVPGCVHLDLLQHKVIDDPFYRDNEAVQKWIGESEWIYETAFDCEEGLLERDQVLLRFEGLDTIATVALNDRPLGKTDNMHRTWDFEVKELLHSTGNRLTVTFHSVLDYIRHKNESIRTVEVWNHHNCDIGEESFAWVRKNACNFGWDWGPKCVTAGIWRPVSLLAWDEAKFEQVCCAQKHTGRHAELTLHYETTGDATGLCVESTLSLNGTPVASGTESLSVDNPQLWWPNGLGEQPLYDLEVRLLDTEGHVLDTWQKRIGLRTIELIREADEWGESFCLAVNGHRFFAKGANWIPEDVFIPRVTETDYRDRLQSAVDAHMNVMRVWGGGVFESDLFYDLCDELGLIVWQDFLFACGTYPCDHQPFLDNVAAEVRDNVRRLRHHACIGLWCGNNENEMLELIHGEECGVYNMSIPAYEALQETLSGTLLENDPDAIWWPSSPHTPGDLNKSWDPDKGDAHLWDVWHGRAPFEWYRGSFHRFCSEFGFQSFPEPDTLKTVMEPQDLNVSSFVMEKHQRSEIGNSAIMDYMGMWFRFPYGFENTVWCSQILQALAIKYAVEHWRRNQPRCMGALYWQLNDCWPVASWASIDSLGRWKALQYAAKNFFAPLLISGVENNKNHTVEIHTTNDLRESVNTVASWTVTDLTGTELRNGENPVELNKSANQQAAVLELADLVTEYGERNLLVWLKLESEGNVVSRNLVSFAKPKHQELLPPNPSIEINMENGRIKVSVSVEHPALYCWFTHPGLHLRWSDQFFHLCPGEVRTFTAALPDGIPLEQVQSCLQFHSIESTYE